jgi:hypothetical protein
MEIKKPMAAINTAPKNDIMPQNSDPATEA